MKTISSSDVLNRLGARFNLNDSGLANRLGINKSTLSNWRKRNTIDWQLVFSLCEQEDLNWLVYGVENTFETKQPVQSIPVDNIHIAEYDNTNIPDYNDESTRPRIPFEAAAGSLSIALDSVSEKQCERLPIIPTFPKYDFTIIARGASMEPNIVSGDELACRFIRESSFIQWGRTHVLDTAQGIVVKRIFEHENDIICKSNNSNYPDFPIPKEDIYHVAIVVGLIRHF